MKYTKGQRITDITELVDRVVNLELPIYLEDYFCGPEKGLDFKSAKKMQSFTLGELVEYFASAALYRAEKVE